MQVKEPIGTKIVFPDTPHNRAILMNPCKDGNGDFTLGKVYEIAGYDNYDEAYFYDNVGDKNFAGCLGDGSDGVYEVVCE